MMMTRMVVVMRTRAPTHAPYMRKPGLSLFMMTTTTTKRGRGGEAHVPLPKEESMPEGMTPT
jgi:hypothetical protein